MRVREPAVMDSAPTSGNGITTGEGVVIVAEGIGGEQRPPNNSNDSSNVVLFNGNGSTLPKVVCGMDPSPGGGEDTVDGECNFNNNIHIMDGEFGKQILNGVVSPSSAVAEMNEETGTYVGAKEGEEIDTGDKKLESPVENGFHDDDVLDDERITYIQDNSVGGNGTEDNPEFTILNDDDTPTKIPQDFPEESKDILKETQSASNQTPEGKRVDPSFSDSGQISGEPFPHHHHESQDNDNLEQECSQQSNDCPSETEHVTHDNDWSGSDGNRLETAAEPIPDPKIESSTSQDLPADEGVVLEAEDSEEKTGSKDDTLEIISMDLTEGAGGDNEDINLVVVTQSSQKSTPDCEGDTAGDAEKEILPSELAAAGKTEETENAEAVLNTEPESVESTKEVEPEPTVSTTPVIVTAEVKEPEPKTAIVVSDVEAEKLEGSTTAEQQSEAGTTPPQPEPLVFVTSTITTTTTTVKSRSPVMSGSYHSHSPLHHFPPPPHHLHPNPAANFMHQFLHPPPSAAAAAATNHQHQNQHYSNQFLHPHQFPHQPQPHHHHLLSTSSLQPAGPALPAFPPPFAPPPFGPAGAFYGPPPPSTSMANAAGGLDLQQKYEPPPWAQQQFVPGAPPSLGGGLGVNSSIRPNPLPTALFPLPLDPSLPPAVLPSFPHGTNQSSGYSTAGHSRSSSPMGGHGSSPVDMSGSSGNSSNSSGTSCPNSLPQCQNPSPNLVFSAASAELTLFSHFPTIPGQYVVYFHINPGVSVSFHVADQLQVVKGPMTVPLVSTNSNPPIPLPMQVPPGHVVQQIVDESGTLRHVIVSHQPPLMPIPTYGPGSQNQQFYSPGPSYPGASPFGPMQGVPYSTQGPTTPPNLMGGNSYMSHVPPHVQKDERVQRQYVKLRKKFEQKQQSEPRPYQGHYNQNGNYRKEGTYNNNNNNNVRRNIPNGAAKTNGGLEEDGSVGSTGSVTSTGTQDEEDESRVLTQTEMLSSLIPPTVCEVTARSACIKWTEPVRFTEAGENKYPEFDVSDTEFRYEVLISDRSRGDARFKSIFLGTALTCKVKDLRPATLYAVSFCCMLNDLKGNSSQTSNFSTLPAEPDPPTSPRAISRSRSSIQFKWNPPNDNGSKVTCFVLEYDEGKGDDNHYVEVYRGKNKYCTVSKLQPAFSYQFRLSAVNQCGPSRWSPIMTVMTAGSPPSQPSPPTLTEAGVTFLILEWACRPTDDQYSLQMEDPTTGHGFICVYNGNAPHYTCVGLLRNSPYKFRVKAQNEEGHSKWSEDVTLRTLPNRPAPPHKPMLKGRIHASSFKVRWEPQDDGGAPISGYSLEIDQGNGRFEEIYRGMELEYNVDKLSPGQSYPIRVVAIGPGGESDPSEPCVITTEPVCPSKCPIPKIIGKPKSNSVNLKWSSPDWDGGSPPTLYEVGCTTPDNQTQEAYRGQETCCSVNRLLPGRAYLFQIRAYNRIGVGPWSDPLEVVTGAGQPDVPSIPKVASKTSHAVVLSWSEPLNNGSAVTEYRVQMATPHFPSSSEEPEGEVVESEGQQGGEQQPEELTDITDHTDSSPAVADLVVPQPPATQMVSTFTQVYSGPTTSCEVKGLQPATTYLFRVQASNYAGNSDWSPVTTHQTPASSPSAVSNVEGLSSTSSVGLTWSPASANGSPILHYNLMLGETLLIASSNEFTLDNLMPDTHYKIRIQAVNGVGPGPFSSALKISTKPLPPQPPKLELVSVAHFWMKLKWNETSPKNIEYIVQMINPYHDEFQVVYRGVGTNCKVTRLTEDTEYQFRICALNIAGQGAFSEMYRFSTLKAPPSQVKGFKVSLVKELEIHRFEWADVSSSHSVTYQLQVAKKRDQEFKTIYRGEVKKFDLKHEELDVGIDYISRVCAIRPCGDGNYLIGPYSNNATFHIPLQPSEDASSTKLQSSSSFTSNLSTTAQKLEDRVNSISYESRVGIIAVISLIILAFFISFITHHVVT